MKLVDSLFLIRLLRGFPDAIKKAEEVDALGDAATTVINVFHLSYGIKTMRDPVRRMEELKRVIANLEVLDLSVEATMKATEISKTYSNNNVSISPFNALIAGIALTSGVEALITRDKEAFRLVSGLKIENF